MGCRFDVLVICWSNLGYVLISLWPNRRYFNTKFQGVLKILYLSCNGLALLTNSIDLAYFKHTNKRLGFDTIHQLFTGQMDLSAQWDDYVTDYLWVIALWGISLAVVNSIWKKTQLNYNSKEPQTTKPKGKLWGLVYFLTALSLIFLGARGGWQYIPLQMVDAGKHADPKFMSLILNTPFTIIRSAESQRLQDLNFMKESEALNYVKPVVNLSGKQFKSKNILIIILEGFSKEFTGLSNRPSRTPFLDSLMKTGLVFTNAWANGKQSIEGIPAIVSAMPSLMPNAFINSVYCTNRMHSLPQLLKQKGYWSGFFHGGKNGTMNFDAYAAAAGFDRYFGMSEYGNDRDFDGAWGIWDEPFLNYCLKTLNGVKPPFFATVFTLSSHHPYNIPKPYAKQFPPEEAPIIPTIRYTDHALKVFFTNAQQSAWFKNTLFVLVPDHTADSKDPFYSNTLGQHAIPIIFYSPDGSLKGRCNTVMQQMDIMPSLLDTLGFNAPFFTWGKSVFKKTDQRCAWFYTNGAYGLVKDSLYTVFLNHKIAKSYLYTQDSSLSRPIELGPVQKNELTKTYQSFLQLYHNRLNSNNTFIK